MNEKLLNWKNAGLAFRYRSLNVFYRREGKGPALLAIHGYPLSSWDFSRVWEDLTARYDVIAPDMIGFGFSDKPRGYPYSLADQADLHEELLLGLGVREAHVLSFDLGTAIAQELLARQDEGRARVRLKSVCFLNGGLFPEVYRPRRVQRLLVSPLGGLIGPLIPAKAGKKAISEVFGPRTKPNAEDLEIFWQLVDFGRGRDVTHLMCRLIADRARHRERWIQAMQRTRVPLRFINGPADPNSGLHMVERYRELIPSPDTVLLDPEIGHFPALEAPRPTARAILEFLGRNS